MLIVVRSPFSIRCLPRVVRMVTTIIGMLLAINQTVHCYQRKPCNSADRAQFQFPDCYVPPQPSGLLLSSASFLMSHNAATGYMESGGSDKASLVWRYSKNQVGSVYDQLNSGARALDLRPKLLNNGTVILHHGPIDIPITYEKLISDVVRWCSDNKDELVLLLPSHFDYESSNIQIPSGNSSLPPIVSALSAIYRKFGITYLNCNQINGLTIGWAKNLSALPSGGFLLAVDGQDYDGTFCGKSNYVSTQLVTCWDIDFFSCKTSQKPFQSLRPYIISSANSPATDDEAVLGPPKNLSQKPFNLIQALWQADQRAIVRGMARFSSILEDNTRSRINEKMLSMIQDGDFNSISLFLVDNVNLHGNALLSVLRTSCGQSIHEECGQDLNPPSLRRFHLGG